MSSRRWEALAVVATISPLGIADALGCLGDLQIKSVGDVTGGPESIQAVATDQADISSIAFDGSIVKAISAGANVKAVIGAYGSNKLSYAALYTLDGSPIKSAEDLVGKKVGVNTLGANEEAFIKLWLKKEGLSADEIGDVQFVVIPPVNAEQALREEQLYSVVLGGALAELAISNGGVTAVAKEIAQILEIPGRRRQRRGDRAEGILDLDPAAGRRRRTPVRPGVAGRRLHQPVQPVLQIGRSSHVT
jgi:ABC-type nitrate/sulfonate/bicarbonate transport system substrate-binding protein